MESARVKVRIPYIQAYKARGKLVTYYRRDGQRIRIHGDPSTAEWKAEYHRIHDNWLRTAAEPLHGSLGWLIANYRSNASYTALRARTRATYDHYLDNLAAGRENAAWNSIDRPTVIKVRDKYADRPSVANYYLLILQVLGERAIDLGLRTDNPARGVKRLKGGKGWRAWESEELLWFEGAEPDGAIRLAYFLALYTGQRMGDVLEMTWRDIDNGVIRVVQEKTDDKDNPRNELWIPIHPVLAEELGDAERRGRTIVSTEDGAPYTKDGFKTMWRRAILSNGLDGVQFHGLRKNATAALAEVGCSEDEIMSITGHKTRAMVSLYTASARRKLMAQSAMRRFANVKVSNIGGR